ncbi:MAG: tripartite tricarboxylate transporter substrate binding protein [Alphaproteobacteria bacterium]|nr:tripartite tricarboxylate transporter substrate binding protein [Alphaproteobacteria bacterium]MCB9929329.1 tripartite tricarboxylate transporter substrate binding protein [Alphaproteobacteria bacterium]
MRILKSLGLAAVAAAGLALAALPARAEWPDGPLTMLIGYKAGGGTDTKGRVLAKLLGEKLGVPVKVVNKPGGGQATALLWFKHQKPDGDTFFFGAVSGLTLNPHLNPRLAFRWDDFDYCCTATEFQPAIVAPSSAPFDDMKGFVAYAKEHPGTKYAALSPYARILMQLIAEKDGLDINYIPTKGGAGMVQLVLGGQVSTAYSGGIHARYPDKMKVLAVTTTKRQPQTPDAPTLTELGYQGASDAPTVIAFPKGTDPAIVAKMDAAVAWAVEQPEMKDISAKLQMPISYMGHDKVTAFVQKTDAETAAMIKASGYEPPK